MNALLDVDRVDYSYGPRSILHQVSLQVGAGEVLCLLGANGSGKTTLLKLLLGLLAPVSGAIRFEGRPLSALSPAAYARRVAYVPQVHREHFAYQVEDVVLMGRMPYHTLFSSFSPVDHQQAEAAMKRLDILHLAQRPYTEISGGERQLVLIARALAQGADILVMDEPVNGLDYGNQIRLLSGIAGLAAEGITCIMTTHYPDHALMTADRVVLLKQGRILADGPPQETITREAIHALYRVEVDVVAVGGNGLVCLPVWTSAL